MLDLDVMLELILVFVVGLVIGRTWQRAVRK
jgi:hypothetical protein